MNKTKALVSLRGRHVAFHNDCTNINLKEFEEIQTIYRN